MAAKPLKFAAIQPNGASSSRIAGWLSNDVKYAPTRSSYRLLRADTALGDVVVLEMPRDSVKAQAFHDAITADLQGLTGQQSYRIIALGAAGEVLASLPWKAKGTALDDGSGGGPSAAAMVNLVKTGVEQSLDFAERTVTMHERLANHHLREIEVLSKQNAILRDKLEDIKIKYAVDKVSTHYSDPVREAQAKLWDKLGDLAMQAPPMLLTMLKQFGIQLPQLTDGGGANNNERHDEDAQQTPRLTSAEEERVVNLCLALSALPFGAVRKAALSMVSNPEFLTEVSEGVDARVIEAIKENAVPFVVGDE